ncbi:hypothetical protein [Aurantibacter sp.]|uniref:hypothetical protein n=1 Tax=Aurantibacter sp. TaxID=2807103 RepID=UPI0032659A19
MTLKSTFVSDVEKERCLAVLLDKYYHKHLRNYNFTRIRGLKNQLKGVDLILTNKFSGKKYFVDEKAQLDYTNEELPTFAFELRYFKNSIVKKGWLFDSKKKTDFYSLITAIYSDEPNKFTSCKITFVNRLKLIQFLKTRNISEKILEKRINQQKNKVPKIHLKQLHPREEGYLYFSEKNKAEKPVNLILKLNFLISQGLAKRFV